MEGILSRETSLSSQDLLHSQSVFRSLFVLLYFVSDLFSLHPLFNWSDGIKEWVRKRKGITGKKKRSQEKTQFPQNEILWEEGKSWRRSRFFPCRFLTPKKWGKLQWNVQGRENLSNFVMRVKTARRTRNRESSRYFSSCIISFLPFYESLIKLEEGLVIKHPDEKEGKDRDDNPLFELDWQTKGSETFSPSTTHFYFKRNHLHPLLLILSSFPHCLVSFSFIDSWESFFFASLSHPFLPFSSLVSCSLKSVFFTPNIMMMFKEKESLRFIFTLSFLLFSSSPFFFSWERLFCHRFYSVMRMK